MSLFLGCVWVMGAVLVGASKEVFLLGLAIIIHAMIVELLGSGK